jgi:hypothetical protein
MDELRRQTASELPLECGKCNRTDQVRVVGDEISCHFCGNFAVVGVLCRFPFVEPPEVREKRAGEAFFTGWFGSANNSDGKGQSPLQVVESIQKSGGAGSGSARIAENISGKRHDSSTASRGRPGSGLAVDEESVKERSDYSRNIPESVQRAVITEEMAAENCKSKQEERMDEFLTKYGITEEEYKANKKYRLESPARVAKRLGRTGTEVAAAETRPAKPERKRAKRETKAPVAETGTGQPDTPDRVTERAAPGGLMVVKPKEVIMAELILRVPVSVLAGGIQVQAMGETNTISLILPPMTVAHGGPKKGGAPKEGDGLGG